MVQGLNYWLDEVLALREFLFSGQKFVGACYQLYEAFKTFYYVQCYFLKQVCTTSDKNQMARCIFGKLLAIVQENYYSIGGGTHNLIQEENVVLSHRHDRKFTQTQYSRLAEAAGRVLDIGQKICTHVITIIRERNH